MARIRTIKPDFWTDEKVVELSFEARLFFIGSWNFADDNGNLQRSAKKLKMQIFPADVIDCEPLIKCLIAQGMLTEYCVNGEVFLHIKAFKQHQVINRPSKTGMPTPEMANSPVPLSESSLTEGKGREGKGREEEGKGEETPLSLSLVPTVEKVDDVRTIFEFWQKRMNSPRSALDANRRGLIERALKNYTPADVCKAISGCSKSPHHMGQNDRSTVYNGLDLILRNAEKIDAFIRMDTAPPAATAGQPLTPQDRIRLQSEANMREFLGDSEPNDAHTIDMEH